MASVEERNATSLKDKYGNNFFINNLRQRGVPTNIRGSNQLFGLIMELENFLGRDNTNQPILNDISQISGLRNDDERTRAINLLTNLGLTYTGPQTQPIPMRASIVETMNVEPVVPRIVAAPRNIRRRVEEPAAPRIVRQRVNEPAAPRNVIEEPVAPTNVTNTPEECPICLDEMTNQTENVITGCGHKFHKECYRQIRPIQSDFGSLLYYCPMCRKRLFSQTTRPYVPPGNTSGGKKRTRKSRSNYSKRRTNKRKTNKKKQTKRKLI